MSVILMSSSTRLGSGDTEMLASDVCHFNEFEYSLVDVSVSRFASDVCHFNEFEYTEVLKMFMWIASDVCHFNEFEYRALFIVA